jgi:hypothetical protein
MKVLVKNLVIQNNINTKEVYLFANYIINSAHENHLPPPHYSAPIAAELRSACGDSYQTMIANTSDRSGLYMVADNADASTAVGDRYWNCCLISDRQTSMADRVCGEETSVDESEEVRFS